MAGREDSRVLRDWQAGIKEGSEGHSWPLEPSGTGREVAKRAPMTTMGLWNPWGWVCGWQRTGRGVAEWALKIATSGQQSS